MLYYPRYQARTLDRRHPMETTELILLYDYYGDLRAVDVAMRRLREKLEDDPADPKHLMTKRGAGYYMQV